MVRISVNDNIKFHTIAEALNKCFGKNYKGWQKATCVFNDSNFAWFPKLAVNKNGVPDAQDKVYGCINILSPDGLQIKESHSAADGEFECCLRFVFAKPSVKEDYRFVGVFKKNMDLSTNSYSIYDRVSETLDLTKYQ